ncbi:hypothetical protein CVT24_013388 [Panaeolus cyanescens]|uniref:F-box domain-containing protein n=1 Tax=Panaeolus cyanescens TaxID=181874 RepID=A0A409YMS0_9AGAR|nr:hypothetical protein CVT24_013388 [Panaeolus cyanescens]
MASTTPTHAPKGLLDLPPEILLLIFEYRCIAADELYQLSVLCRHLHWPAMHTFLSRKRVTDLQNIILRNIVWNPDQFIAGSAPLDALAGLNASTFMCGASVKTLHCYFQYPNSPYNMFQYPSNLNIALRRLATFVRKLKSLDVIRIYLLSEKRYLHRQADFPSDGHLAEWTESFLELAGLIVGRGCVEMTIQYDGIGSAMEFSFTNAAPNSRAHRIGHFIGRRLEKHQWLRPLVPKKLRFMTLPFAVSSKTALPVSSIRSLCIHSTVLLTPSFLPWTMRLLKESPNLTSISFAHLSFGADVWSRLLPDLAKVVSHKLIEFSILESCWKLSTDDLLFFLDRLPRLTKLVIDRAVQIWVCEEADEVVGVRTPIPALDCLETLQAPEDLILHLLKPPHRRFWEPATRRKPYTPLPSLRHVTVYPSSLLVDTTSYAPCAERWLSLQSTINQHRRTNGPITYTLDLQADFAATGKYTGIASYLEYRELYLQDSSSPPPSFSGVSEVVMYHFDNHYPNDKPQLFCQWLKVLFPDVRMVTFTGVLSTLPEQVLRMKEGTVVQLMKSLGEKCPGVDVLRVPESEYRKVDGRWIQVI